MGSVFTETEGGLNKGREVPDGFIFSPDEDLFFISEIQYCEYTTHCDAGHLVLC